MSINAPAPPPSNLTRVDAEADAPGHREEGEQGRAQRPRVGQVLGGVARHGAGAGEAVPLFRQHPDQRRRKRGHGALEAAVKRVHQIALGGRHDLRKPAGRRSREMLGVGNSGSRATVLVVTLFRHQHTLPAHPHAHWVVAAGSGPRGEHRKDEDDHEVGGKGERPAMHGQQLRCNRQGHRSGDGRAENLEASSWNLSDSGFIQKSRSCRHRSTTCHSHSATASPLIPTDSAP